MAKLQRCALKPIAIGGAQTCPRDRYRELTKAVCNIAGGVLTPPCGVPAVTVRTFPSSITPARSHCPMSFST